MTKPIYLQCTDCGHNQEYHPLEPTICGECASTWVEAQYDYASFKRELLRGLPSRPFNIWRYHEVLPVENPLDLNLDSIGGTPMRLSHNYAKYLDFEKLHIKDERVGPTNSFKDRQAAISVAQMREAGIQEMVIASTGNAAVAYAAACAQGGIKTLREGLQAALEHLDEKTTTVLIIDDNPDDAHLIRRILESRKSYRVFHTNDSWDGLAQARQRLPDLIVLDLMMPQLDGFGVLEELKLDKRTRHIPIIVVSAKDISVAERKQLEGQIEALYQKGSLPPRKFAEQVIEVIEGKSANKGES